MANNAYIYTLYDCASDKQSLHFDPSENQSIDDSLSPCKACKVSGETFETDEERLFDAWVSQNETRDDDIP